MRRLALRLILLAFGTIAVACAPAASDPPAQAASSLETRLSAQASPAVAASAPVAPSVSGFDGAQAWTHLERIVAFGPRPSGSQALADTRAYLTQTLQSLGLKVERQRFTADTPLGRVAMENLVVRIAGKRPDRILLTGHYDTKLMPNIRFVGASDGGSSAAWLLEAARVLATRPGEFTYELVWFDGEEAVVEWQGLDNRYGSRHYVATAIASKTLASIKAMILVDMISSRDLQIRRDSNSTSWLNEIIFATANRLAYSHIFVPGQTAVEDDHIPFLTAGVPAIDVIVDLNTYPYWHTADDTLDKQSPRSLQAVGDVVLTALPEIEARLRR
jgi:glutaminyl-peptide cyclotransferase